MTTPGHRFRKLVATARPLQVVGTINAYSAILARDMGHEAIYLSGAGVANASHGLPDLGVTTLTDVVDDARRILQAVDLPMLVDIDTGWGGRHMVRRTIHELESVGVAAVHIEDQVGAKRCGHRPDKELVPTEEMVARIEAACEARTDPQFVIMARTDATAVEGIESALERAKAYRDAGADMLFPEALEQMQQYRRFKEELKMPILANLTEFGKTPLYSVEDLNEMGIDIGLYPLSAFRAMSKAALEVYRDIKLRGTQKGVVDLMQTREELYEHLGYHELEKTHG